MASAYRYWETVSTYDNPKIWLFRVAGQRLSDQREKRRRLALTGDLETLDCPHQDDLARVEAQHQLLTLLRKLPIHQAVPVVLFYYGFSDQEIGEIVGIAATSARSSRCRGMKALRELVAVQVGSEEAK
jgi:DNA-directed RNA polymerase specialized sigma24 family protein